MILIATHGYEKVAKLFVLVRSFPLWLWNVIARTEENHLKSGVQTSFLILYVKFQIKLCTYNDASASYSPSVSQSSPVPVISFRDT